MATRLSKIVGDSALPRVPPHNLEAEESVLGACLLSRQAIATAIETLAPDDFYKPAHAEMFKIMLDLYARGEPLDAVMLGEELRRRGNLDEFGGKPYLFTLVSSVPTPGSVGHYARIVQENATLRRLIDASQQISDIAFALPEDVEEAVDQAEDLVYQVTNRRMSEDLAALKDLLTENMEMVEKLYERGSAITGVATGFTDLDDITAGLQPSNLIIVAARPSMGKALALDTPIPTPTGWTPMGDLRAGDEVFDQQGRVCRIAHVSPVYVGRECYEVEFDDGTVIVADADHQWLAWEASGVLEPRVVTTAAMLAEGVEIQNEGPPHPRWYLLPAESLELPEADLPVDPYLLGCCLGDGHTAGTRQATRDQDRSHLVGEFEAAGYDLEGRPSQHEAARLLTGDRDDIPGVYLRASFKQRLALLQGLMDTSWTVTSPDGAVELWLTDRELLAQARELVCSLGDRPGPIRERIITLEGGRAGKAWRFSWSPLDPVFRLARKADRLAARQREQASSIRRLVVGIRPIPSVPVRCIQVDSPSHLYLAGRSMVPTHNSSLALSIAQHVATNDNLPVIIFSLEMSKMELVQRLMCSEARVDSNRLRKGALQDSDWPKLSLALGRLAEAPIFIDDTPNATIMEMRAKCRRVSSKQGLGLVIIDYLQLMAPLKRTDNRVQEVSEISRSLKILARELDVPVIALSQLSRNVEYRADKRPLLADLRESGCLTAGTRLLRADTGAEITFGDLIASGEKPIVWSLDEKLRMVPRPIEKVFPSGVKEVFRVRLASGRTVEASANHPFLTLDGWIPLGELLPGSRVGVPRRVPEPLCTQPMPEPEIALLASLTANRVPGPVFSLPNEQLALFLRHLWAAGGSVWWDETAGMARLSYASTSRQLIDDVSQLLLRFGILSRSERATKAGYRDWWHLVMSGAENQLRFLDGIGVHGLRGQTAQVVAERLRGIKGKAHVDTVPLEVWSRVKASMERNSLGDHELSVALTSRLRSPTTWKHAPGRKRLAKFAEALGDPSLDLLATSDIFWDEIVEVDSLGPQPVYDATISDTHNFIANGIDLHNSIEQDADVVMFIYRDEVYHPDSPQRGIAEIHISKHRSGPIGKVELTFLEHYTKFANLARGM